MNHLRIVLLLVLLVACQSARDTTPPTIARSSPANGATAVPTSATVEFTFSEAMDQASVTLSVTPQRALAPVWTDAVTVTFTPTSGWLAGTQYALSVAGRDLAGNALAGTTQIVFETVLDTVAPAVPTNIQATAAEAGFSLSWEAGSEADLAGATVYWGEAEDALTSALFVPAPEHAVTIGDLENGLTYYFAVEAQDTAGNRSPRSAIGSVTPRDVTPPTLLSSEPADGASDLALVPVLRFTFSEAMDKASPSFGLCVSDVPPADATCDAPIAATFGSPTWTEGDTVLQVIPTDQLQGGKTHVLVVSARDRAGNALSGPSLVAFALRVTPDLTPPAVLGHGGDYGADRPGAVLTFTFSEAMDQQSVEEAFLSQPPMTCSWTWQDETATCTIRGYLEQFTDYRVALSVTAADTAGNPLAVPYALTFTTGNFAPRLTAVSPKSNSVGIKVTAPIVLTFSEAMDQDSVQNALSVKAGGSEIGGTTEWNPEHTVATFRPETSYGYGRVVAWTLGTGARETPVGRTTGKGLAAEASGSFLTEMVIGFGTEGGGHRVR